MKVPRRRSILTPLYRELAAGIRASAARKAEIDAARTRCEDWARLYFDLKEAGKRKQAAVAKRKAEFWERRWKGLQG